MRYILRFFSKYIFSLDHKVIGIQYGLTAMAFFLAGFIMMLMMRWQLAYPQEANPLLSWVGSDSDYIPEGVMLPEFYNSLGAMHGTVMIFLAVVPMVVGAFGNYLIPLMIGAPDMAFPKLNMMSYWIYLVGGLVMMSSFFVPGGAPNSGWTSYPPLSVIAFEGQTIWLIAMVLIITSSLLGSINIITTILQLRTKGLTFLRLPFLVWSQLIVAFLLLLAFPPLEAAGLLMLSDRLLDTSFFLPSGLVVSNQALENVAGGGSPLLWQHLFWFLAHPEVYVLILPALGIVAEIVANNTRKPLWGYHAMVGSVLFIGFMSFIVWAHHMFLTGMGTTMSAIFETTTMIISIPSVVILTALVGTLWGGSIRFNVPMLFALAFIPMFGIGGLTGLPLGLGPTDIQLHDTMYIIGHFHYIVAPGTIFAIFAGVYYWFPKITGKKMNTLLGHLHFWPSLIAMNGIFMPMFIQGMAGVNRRLADGGAYYAHAQDVLIWNVVMTHSAFLLAVVQVFFLINFVGTLLFARKAEDKDNPWQATTLEWSAPSPPIAHGNFETAPVVYRGPYEYSVPGDAEDFSPQTQPEPARA